MKIWTMFLMSHAIFHERDIVTVFTLKKDPLMIALEGLGHHQPLYLFSLPCAG